MARASRGAALLLVFGCQAAEPERTAPVGVGPDPVASTHDFIVTEMTFHAPEGLREDIAVVPNPCGVDAGSSNATYQPLVLDGLEVDGFDLDGTEGDATCPHADYVSPSGQGGIDYAFLHVMDMIRPARPGQTIEVVLSSAPAQGLLKIGIRLTDVDDLTFDDDVGVLVTTTMDAPLIGADGEILAGSSVTVDTNPDYRSAFRGRIEDGVLLAGPADVVIGNIDLLVIEDRVVSLRGTQIRATVEERPFGGYDVDALIGGWWHVDDMTEAIDHAIRTIGANAGELDCVLRAHADRSSDGMTCDEMSTMVRMKAVSGFLTGLDDPEEG
jgi:hypothetical protein